MPTYEYKCEKCGDFELWQSIKDDALKSCPKCGSKVERLISANVGFVFKGSGFYQTDYKSKNSAPPAPVTAATKPADPSGSTGQAPSAKPLSSSKDTPQADSTPAKPLSSSKGSPQAGSEHAASVSSNSSPSAN